MIYVKRVANADVTRQIDLNKEGALFFGFDPNSATEIDLTFINEDNGDIISGTVKKSGHTPTITGQIYKTVKETCTPGDIIVFSTTKSSTNFNVKLVSQKDKDYKPFDHALNLLGSRSSVINTTTHLLMSLDDNDTSSQDNGNNQELENLCEEILLLLKENGNVVLTGAPGTGKTYLAKQLAAKIVGDCAWKDLTDEHKKYIRFVQFHPSYDYTDFVEGLRPDKTGNFVRTDGDFKKLCKDAATDPDNYPYVFVIDEINRGEISKIFGELFYSIEKDYRGDETRVRTQYNNMVEENDVFYPGFYVPENIFIIGTMNDIDRGVEAMDFAIRRRFAWREVTAEESAANMGISGLAKIKMDALNKEILKAELSEAYCIGGAYFRKVKNNDFEALWNYHLKGIVSEYFRGDPDFSTKVRAIEEAYKNAGTPSAASDYTTEDGDNDEQN